MKTYDLYLSYSGKKTYDLCPRKYELAYVQKKHPKEDPRSALFGIAMGKIFEWFYNKRFWTTSDPVRKCFEVSDSAISLACDEKGFLESSDPEFVGKLRQDVRESIPPTIESIRKHKLLSEVSRSEVDLTVLCRKGPTVLKMGGRADFVHGSSTAFIIDGKGGRHREKYVDADQLIWYALLHYVKYHVAPVRLGFLYYRFPNDPIQWIIYNEQDLRRVFDSTFKVASEILGKSFPVNPSKECGRCGFNSICLDGRRYLSGKRVANGGRINSSVFDFESVTFEHDEPR